MTAVPYLTDPDLTLYVGDALEVLRTLPDGSVDCCVTSPPYWGLRDYGTGTWDGGDPECDHRASSESRTANAKAGSGLEGSTDTLHMSIQFRDVCGKCGARRVDRQLGLEPTPDAYVDAMVAVFREVRRVLADHGTCWINLGDSYASSGIEGAQTAYTTGRASGDPRAPARKTLDAKAGRAPTPPGLKPKDLVGVPWRVAFALQQDGWYLRSDIIWAKPNPMPESVTDRPTKAHEYVFLLSKSPRYWFDQEAVREPAEWAMWGAQTVPKYNGTKSQSGWMEEKTKAEREAMRSVGRNVRSVWEIATQPYPEAHFATFPEALARRCILAGCPEWVCDACGAPRERVGKSWCACGCLVRLLTEGSGEKARADEHPSPSVSKWHPGIVLDPFAGSGTTALVARKHGRRSILIELNETYARMAAQRLSQLSLLAEA